MAQRRNKDAYPTRTPNTASEPPARANSRAADAPADYAALGVGLDPERLARFHLFDAVQRAASAGKSDFDADAIARTVAAVDFMAGHAGDQTTREEASEQVDNKLHMLATAPALTVSDVVPKVAALVLDLARSGSSGELMAGTASFILAACILADVTLLRNGPIALPSRGLDPVDNTEIMAHWRQMAEARQ